SNPARVSRARAAAGSPLETGPLAAPITLVQPQPGCLPWSADVSPGERGTSAPDRAAPAVRSSALAASSPDCADASPAPAWAMIPRGEDSWRSLQIIPQG